MPRLHSRKLIKVQMTPVTSPFFPPLRHHSVRRNIDSAGGCQIIKWKFFLRREIQLPKSKQWEVVMSTMGIQTSCLAFKKHRVKTLGIRGAGSRFDSMNEKKKTKKKNKISSSVFSTKAAGITIKYSVTFCLFVFLIIMINKNPQTLQSEIGGR